MTVIEMAQAAGFEVAGDLYGEDALITKITRLVEFEREECAKVCDVMGDATTIGYVGEGCKKAARAIRARGQQ